MPTPDVNRGCRIRKHPSSMLIYMYKNEPGVYYNGHGHKVSVELAKEAGFPTKEYAKAKQRREKMATAQEMIDKELDFRNTDRKVLKERGAYQLLDMGLGRASVIDVEGYALNNRPIPLELAEKLMNDMADADEQEQKEAEKLDKIKKDGSAPKLRSIA